MIIINEKENLSDIEFISLINLLESNLISEEDFFNESDIIEKSKNLLNEIKKLYKDITYADHIKDIQSLDELRQKEIKRLVATSIPNIIMAIMFSFRLTNPLAMKNLFFSAIRILTPLTSLFGKLYDNKMATENELKSLRNRLQGLYNKNQNIIDDENRKKENKNFINKRKWLSAKINNLTHERWTIELGKTIIKTIEELLELYKITIQEIVKGLDITKYHMKTINMLNRVVVIYSENQNKLTDS